MDLPSWEHDLKVDLEVINALLDSMAKVTPEDDAKLQHLKALILSKIENPINDGNRKVLVFTAFSDTRITSTTTWRIPYWQREAAHGKVTARIRRINLRKNYDFQSLLTLFLPRQGEGSCVPNEPADWLLIGTDCIPRAEPSVCDYLVNYDTTESVSIILDSVGSIASAPSTRHPAGELWPTFSGLIHQSQGTC
jgi:hypothetical protein